MGHYGGLNPNKQKNDAKIKELIAKGYVDLGWANGGKSFTHSISERKESLDCGLYSYRGTNTVYIDHINKEILHVDSSD